MNNAYQVRPIAGPLAAIVRPPGSKSLTNRALVCAALAAGRSTLSGILDSEDTRVMTAAWQQLDLPLRVDWNEALCLVSGCGGQRPARETAAELALDVANSGTSMRFLAAVLTALAGRYRLLGTERMHERPIGDLVAALRRLGGGISAAQGNTLPPVRIDSQGLQGGTVDIAADTSSQFVSALMLAAPMARGPIVFEVTGTIVSRPYIAMTARVMQAFGVDVEVGEDGRSVAVDPQIYQPAEFAIEPDASAASYFFAAAAIVGGKVTVQGLNRRSWQGDIAFVDLLKQMGCLVEESSDAIAVIGPAKRGIDCDLRDLSDTAQTLAAVALFVDSPTTIRGIAHNRFKETDRIGHLARELRKIGAEVREFEDGLTITPGELRGAPIETYRDHRMAMSFALVGLRLNGLSILDPACVGKTFPHFFDVLERLAVE